MTDTGMFADQWRDAANLLRTKASEFDQIAERYPERPRPSLEELHDFLVRVDSTTSLIAHRYTKGLDQETIDDLKALSHQARGYYERKPRR